METFIQDVRYGFRALLKSPGFSLIAILSLALGIGANTAIFSIVDALLLQQLPVHEPDRLAVIGQGRGAGIWNGMPGDRMDLVSEPELLEFRKTNPVFQDVCGVFSINYELHPFVSGSPRTEEVKASAVTGNYFAVLGVRPAAGRLFTDAEDTPLNAHPDLVISYAWWRRRFGGSLSAIGQSMKIGKRLYTIVGVAAPEFFGIAVGESPDAWFPLSMQSEVPPFFNLHEGKLDHSLYVIGRLKPGVTMEQGRAHTDLRLRQILRAYMGPSPSASDLKDLRKTRIELNSVATGISNLRRRFSLPLQVLMGVVALVLLIACANVANLLLARATARQKELAIRFAVGSGRLRLIRQLLTESLMLSLAGGGLGIILAMWGSRLLLHMASTGPKTIPLNVDPNLHLLAFTIGVALLTGILFGFAPAFSGSSIDLTTTLKEGRGGTASPSRMFAGRALVVSQVALSLMLLIGAGLFIRSFGNLERIDAGFSRDNILQFSMDTSSLGYQPEALTLLYRRLEERVSRIPGVQAASLSMFSFGPGIMNTFLTVEGYPEIARKSAINIYPIGTDYFKTLGIPMLMGRAFGPQDTAHSPKAVILNEKAARDIFGGESPIGRHMGYGGPETVHDLEIVGVVKNSKYEGLREETPWASFVPYTQRGEFIGNLFVKVQGDSRPVVAQVRRTLEDLDRNLPITGVATMEEMVDRTLVSQRIVAQLSTFFGALALLLAAIGLYGILSYSVALRTSEIGVRVALGAQSIRVLWMILRETLLLLALGVIIGVPVALFCSRYIESMLYGLKAADAFTMAAAVLILLAIGSLAGLLPARRAARVDPMIALRYE